MKIWFDADNAPHVLIMRPLAEELARRGHEVHFTARDRASTCELMAMYGLPYTKVAGEFGRGMAGKASGTIGRAVALALAMRRWRADVSFGHGSRALPIASRMLGIPSVTMYDYEWVNPILFNLFCRLILLPQVIDAERCREARIAVDKVRSYPGFKEELYLHQPIAADEIARNLGLKPDHVHVLLRPPATKAHYHNPEAETILSAILDRLAAATEVQVVYLARGREQMAFLGDRRFSSLIVPSKVYDGPALISCMDLVIGGGGTMTREAAIMGIPSYSFFRGRLGKVDEALAEQGRLAMLESASRMGDKLRLTKRLQNPIPDLPAALPAIICDHIIESAD